MSYYLWCATVCYPETSRNRRPWPALNGCAQEEEEEDDDDDDDKK
jgi:hypothetical protein